MDTIDVEPITNGWMVRADAIENNLVFRSGKDAEDAARGLAIKIAGIGEPVRIRLKLKNGETAARFLCLPPVEPCEPARLLPIPQPLNVDPLAAPA